MGKRAGGRSSCLDRTRRRSFNCLLSSCAYPSPSSLLWTSPSLPYSSSLLPCNSFHFISCMKMPPRGSEGYDFTPILTHYLFLFTTILAVVCHSLYSIVIRHLLTHYPPM